MTEIKFCPQCGNKINGMIKFCPSCGNKLAEDFATPNTSISSKREKVLNHQNQSNKKGWITAAIVVLFTAAVILYINLQPTKEESIINNQPQVTESTSYPVSRYDHVYSIAVAENGIIKLPLDIVKEKKFVKFDYVIENRTNPLLAYITEDGKVVTAISLCEPCDSRDFHIIGSTIVCNSCGTTWELNNLEAISGSCGKYPPDPIPSKVVDNEIQIDESIVVNWSRRNT